MSEELQNINLPEPTPTSPQDNMPFSGSAGGDPDLLAAVRDLLDRPLRGGRSVEDRVQSAAAGHADAGSRRAAEDPVTELIATR